MYIKEFRSFNYNIYEKHKFNYVLNLITLKAYTLLLYAQYVKMNVYNCIYLFEYNIE